MGGVFLAVKINGAFVQQGAQDVQILPQVGEGRAQAVAEHSAHCGTVAGANAQPQPPGGQLLQNLHLLGDYNGMARVGGDDGGAKEDAVGLDGGGGEQREGVQARSAGGKPGGVDAGGLGAAHQVQGRFGVGGAGVQANSVGGHSDIYLGDGLGQWGRVGMEWNGME